jgi:hypothetical protein
MKKDPRQKKTDGKKSSGAKTLAARTMKSKSCAGVFEVPAS